MNQHKETLRDKTSVFDTMSDAAMTNYIESKIEAMAAIPSAHSFVLFAVHQQGQHVGSIQVISSLMGVDPAQVIAQLRDTADKLEKTYAENIERRRKEEGYGKA